jgi:hypothetical protein
VAATNDPRARRASGRSPRARRTADAARPPLPERTPRPGRNAPGGRTAFDVTEPAACCTVFSANSGQAPIVFSNTTELDVVTLQLGPGSYVVNAKVFVQNRDSQDGREIVCTLRRGQTGNIWIDTAWSRLFGGGPWTPGSVAMMPLTGTFTLTTQETIRLHCTTSATDAAAQFGQLNATAVDSITT